MPVRVPAILDALPACGLASARHAGVLLLACGLLASCGSDEAAESPQTTTSTVTTANTVPDEPAQTIADARRAADRDEYNAALAISRSLRPAEARALRGRIANRLAERALVALDAGERGRAREFIIEAKSYPSTTKARFARATYQAAKEQAAEERRRNAEQRRIDEAMRLAGSMKPPPMRMLPQPSMGMNPPPP